MTSSNGQVAQAAERFELSRGEASTIELNAGERGVVKVKGWKQPEAAVHLVPHRHAPTHRHHAYRDRSHSSGQPPIERKGEQQLPVGAELQV